VFRYTVYEDFEKVIAKNKAELYSKIDEGDVDWFSEYDDSDDQPPEIDPEERKQYNDYRYTECYSSIKPPDLVSFQPDDPNKTSNLTTSLLDEEKSPDKSKTENYEMRKPRLMLTQNYFEHVQRLQKHNTGELGIFIP